MKRLVLAVLALICFLTAAGCSGSEPELSAEETSSAETTAPETTKEINIAATETTVSVKTTAQTTSAVPRTTKTPSESSSPEEPTLPETSAETTASSPAPTEVDPAGSGGTTSRPDHPYLGPIDDGKPYYIKVNNLCNTVTVYARDSDGYHTVPLRAMICSTGADTPQNGIYSLYGKGQWTWLPLLGNVYGRYCTQISGNILFHSVPYLTYGDNSSLKYAEFDKLGTSASMGCIRLLLSDAMWIYSNMSQIAGVEFYSDPNPGPLGKPDAPKISENEECRGWDPTDTDPENPWNKTAPTTTAETSAAPSSDGSGESLSEPPPITE